MLDFPEDLQLAFNSGLLRDPTFLLSEPKMRDVIQSDKQSTVLQERKKFVL